VIWIASVLTLASVNLMASQLAIIVNAIGLARGLVGR